jgi:hypothetical protein
MSERLTVQKALRTVRDSADGLYGILLENGSMELGYYKPVGADDQTPHDQDEIYIVQTGTGTLVRGEENIPYAPGDALFVAAGVEHRFVDFSDDFAAWVIFYGTTGGDS